MCICPRRRPPASLREASSGKARHGGFRQPRSGRRAALYKERDLDEALLGAVSHANPARRDSTASAAGRDRLSTGRPCSPCATPKMNEVLKSRLFSQLKSRGIHIRVLFVQQAAEKSRTATVMGRSFVALMERFGNSPRSDGGGHPEVVTVLGGSPWSSRSSGSAKRPGG